MLNVVHTTACATRVRLLLSVMVKMALDEGPYAHASATSHSPVQSDTEHSPLAELELKLPLPHSVLALGGGDGGFGDPTDGPPRPPAV